MLIRWPYEVIYAGVRMALQQSVWLEHRLTYNLLHAFLFRYCLPMITPSSFKRPRQINGRLSCLTRDI